MRKFFIDPKNGVSSIGSLVVLVVVAIPIAGINAVTTSEDDDDGDVGEVLVVLVGGIFVVVVLGVGDDAAAVVVVVVVTVDMVEDDGEGDDNWVTLMVTWFVDTLKSEVAFKTFKSLWYQSNT